MILLTSGQLWGEGGGEAELRPFAFLIAIPDEACTHTTCAHIHACTWRGEGLGVSRIAVRQGGDSLAEAERICDNSLQRLEGVPPWLQ